MAGTGNQQDEDNSDLEVVDVISAKPTRKARDPEVVELSDSESEAEVERPGPTSPETRPAQSTARPGDSVSPVWIAVSAVYSAGR